MSRSNIKLTPEIFVTIFLLILAGLSLLFLDSLVAAPKTLFGRSLSAIAPSVFPSLILALLAAMCAFHLFVSWRAPGDGTEQGEGIAGWMRGASLFAIMAFTRLPWCRLDFCFQP